MSAQDRFPLDFPGYLRTNEGGYVTHKDFLAFIDRAATYSHLTGEDRAIKWLRRRGATGDFTTLPSTKVSRLLGAAQEIIVARHTRGRRGLPQAAFPEPNVPIPDNVPSDDTDPASDPRDA